MKRDFGDLDAAVLGNNFRPRNIRVGIDANEECAFGLAGGGILEYGRFGIEASYFRMGQLMGRRLARCPCHPPF